MRSSKSKRKKQGNASDPISDKSSGSVHYGDEERAALLTPSPVPSFIQPKLTLASITDNKEKEASVESNKVAGQQSDEPELPEGNKNANNSSDVPPIVYDALESGGEPMDGSVRNFMESKLGEDFSNVNIHNNTKASESAEAIQASAYTVGNNIVFRKDHYRPETEPGKRLIAHELVHVAQQSKNTDAKNTVQRFPFVLTKRVRVPSGSVNIGPGIILKWNGNAISIEATMEIYGADATDELAKDIKSNIEKTWTGSFDDGYSISCKADVTHRAAGTSENGNATQIEIVNNKAPSNVRRSWLVGSRYMTYNLGTAAINFTPGHEFGHLLGLGDRYSESIISKIKSKFGGERSTTIDKGWEGNLMAERGGKLEKKNVEELLQMYAYKDVIIGMPEDSMPMEA